MARWRGQGASMMMAEVRRGLDGAAGEHATTQVEASVVFTGGEGVRWCMSEWKEGGGEAVARGRGGR